MFRGAFENKVGLAELKLAAVSTICNLAKWFDSHSEVFVRNMLACNLFAEGPCKWCLLVAIMADTFGLLVS